VELTPVQVRVAASLVEKELLTPDNYPLSMNALLAACNQTSNRYPVVDYDQHTVANALENLKGSGLARVVYSRGMRVDKYRHVLDEALHIDRPALAVLSVLMLRGPQTAAELRTRTERSHPTASQAEVEETLEALARHEPPLAVLLPRQPGQKEPRWAHLLAGEVTPETAAASAAPADRPSSPRADRLAEVEERLAALEARMEELERARE
jgi:uncharacterized protein YceH (UPF0502 family)